MLTTIRVVMLDSTPVEVRACVRGVWALHRELVHQVRWEGSFRRLVRILDGYGKGNRWTVTHVPSNGRVLSRLSLVEGWKLLVLLAREVPFLARDAGVHQSEIGLPASLRGGIQAWANELELGLPRATSRRWRAWVKRWGWHL